jgi:uncharacterized membrane protein YccC
LERLHIPAGFLRIHSVVARNSLRTGVGLALAVAVSHLFPMLHGFWVVLGTMAVLASSALVTRTKMVQAVTGAAVGVTVAAVLIAAFTIAPPALWSLLPIAVFGSAYLLRLFSFAVAHAVTTLTTLIILDLMVPTGWRIGLLRIEDVAMGAGVGMVVSLLLWPRGAIAAMSAVISAAFDVNVPYLARPCGVSPVIVQTKQICMHSAATRWWSAGRSTTLSANTFRKPAAGPTCGPRWSGRPIGRPWYGPRET